MENNPYAPPTVDSELDQNVSNAANTRRYHLKHEASVRSIGTLYIIGGLFFLGFFVVGLAGIEIEGMETIAGMLVLLAIGIGQIFVGISVRRLKPVGRILAIILSVLGLLALPIGTLISLYFLYLLCSKKGKTVFSSEYAAIRAATPEVKYRTSVVTWVVLGLLLLLLVSGMFFATQS